MATLANGIQGIRCGNHGAARVYHLSTEEVRDCFTPEPAPVTEAPKRKMSWWNLPIAGGMWSADSRDLYR